jgi:hypothetical protein
LQFVSLSLKISVELLFVICSGNLFQSLIVLQKNENLNESLLHCICLMGFEWVDPKSVKDRAYQSLVRPILEYCCSVWDPYTIENIYKIEQVQRRAVRYACHRHHNTSSVILLIVLILRCAHACCSKNVVAIFWLLLLRCYICLCERKHNI